MLTHKNTLLIVENLVIQRETPVVYKSREDASNTYIMHLLKESLIILFTGTRYCFMLSALKTIAVLDHKLSSIDNGSYSISPLSLRMPIRFFPSHRLSEEIGHHIL